jgi:hypothetical protein
MSSAVDLSFNCIVILAATEFLAVPSAWIKGKGYVMLLEDVGKKAYQSGLNDGIGFVYHSSYVGQPLTAFTLEGSTREPMRHLNHYHQKVE